MGAFGHLWGMCTGLVGSFDIDKHSKQQWASSTTEYVSLSVYLPWYGRLC